MSTPITITPEITKRASQFFLRGFIAQAKAADAKKSLSQLGDPAVAGRINKQASARVSGLLSLVVGHRDAVKAATAA
jgi:hypothetical protein